MGSEARPLHIFFFPLMAQGHSIPMTDIARLFAARGIKSTIISTPLNAHLFADSLHRDKKAGLDIGILTIPFPAVEAGLPEGCESMNMVSTPEMIFCFIKANNLLQEPFEKLLEEHRPDCIVADMMFTWATDTANKYGIPRLVFTGTSNFSISVFENIRQYAPQDKVESDTEAFVIPGLPDKIEFTKSQLPHRGRTDEENPFTEMRNKMREAEEKSFGTVVNSFHELEPEYAEYYTKVLGRRAWNVGPVSLCNRSSSSKADRGKKSSISESQCLSWLDSKKPSSVIYVSFGSMSRFGAAQLHEIAMGLEASEIPFIWVVRTPENSEKEQVLPEGFEERMQGKGLVIREWAPQVLILDHPSVGGFMTHCGWNSTLEGISAGLPLITWPVFAEQFNNEKLITQVLKTGIPAGIATWNAWFETKEVSVTNDRIKEVVIQLMGDEEEAKDMRIRAKHFGEMAKKAVEEDGSSYKDLSALIEKLQVHAS
ncbi:hypothetical protein ACHQM5_023912 [Ranunculus cassubicifolius]